MRLGCFYILIAFSISIYGNVCTKRLTQNPQEMQSNIRMVDDRSQTNHRWHRTRGLKDYSKLLTVAIFNKLKNLKSLMRMRLVIGVCLSKGGNY
jgi:hypothetical protein